MHVCARGRKQQPVVLLHYSTYLSLAGIAIRVRRHAVFFIAFIRCCGTGVVVVVVGGGEVVRRCLVLFLVGLLVGLVDGLMFCSFGFGWRWWCRAAVYVRPFVRTNQAACPGHNLFIVLCLPSSHLPPRSSLALSRTLFAEVVGRKSQLHLTRGIRVLVATTGIRVKTPADCLGCVVFWRVACCTSWS